MPSPALTAGQRNTIDPSSVAISERSRSESSRRCGLREDAFVLDVGCGTGEGIRYLARWVKRGFLAGSGPIAPDDRGGPEETPRPSRGWTSRWGMPSTSPGLIPSSIRP